MLSLRGARQISGNNVRMSIFTQEENVERLAHLRNSYGPDSSQLPMLQSDREIYSTISKIARWPWRAAELASRARTA